MKSEGEDVKYVNQILFSLFEKPKRKIDIFAYYYPDKVRWKDVRYQFKCKNCGFPSKREPQVKERISKCKRCKSPLFKRKWGRQVEPLFKRKEKSAKQNIPNYEIITYEMPKPVILQKDSFTISWYNKTKNLFQGLEKFRFIRKDYSKAYSLQSKELVEFFSKNFDIAFSKSQKDFLLFLFEAMRGKLNGRKPSDFKFNFLHFICLFFIEELKSGIGNENEVLIGEKATDKYGFWIEERKQHILRGIKITERNEIIKKYGKLHYNTILNSLKQKKISVSDNEYVEHFFIDLYRKLREWSRKMASKEYVLIQELKRSGSIFQIV